MCGDPKHTIQHVIWTCPALHAGRLKANAMLATLQVEAIPQSVLIGIAPAMCVFPCQPYWGNTADATEQDLSVDHARFIGINKVISTTGEDGSVHHNKISEEAESTIQKLTEIWGDSRNSGTILAITARKALGHLRQGRFEYEIMTLPRREYGEPPANINVYADGGLTAPTDQHLGLPAAGIFVKNRFGQHDEEGDELEAAEAQFDQSYKQLLDRCIRIPIPGLVNSSTRSEAHGLLGGLCTKGPVHIGIDNKAVVYRAGRLIGLALDLCLKRDDDVGMRSGNCGDPKRSTGSCRRTGTSETPFGGSSSPRAPVPSRLLQ